MEFKIEDIQAIVSDDCDINPKAAQWLINQLTAANRVIAEANAQEPFRWFLADRVNQSEDMLTEVTGNIDPAREVLMPMYLRPIPAQQTIDRDMIINVLLSIGNMSEGIIADAIISAIGAQQSPSWKLGKMNGGKIVEQTPVSQDYNFLIPIIHFARQIKPQVNLPEQDRLIESMQSELEKVQEYIRNNHKQSPAVAVPDLKQEYKLFCKFCDENPILNLDPRLHTNSGQIESGGYIDQVIANVAFKAWRARAGVQSPRITDNPTELEMHRADYNAIKSAGFESPGELLAAYNHLLSNRITEQEALDIANSAIGFSIFNRGTCDSKNWLEIEGRALLDKLNGAKNAR